MRTPGTLFVTLVASLLLTPGAAPAEESWFPSRYGAGDTLGAINLLSPSRVVEAARLVTTGKTYALGVETGPDTPAYPGRSYRIVTMASGDGSGVGLGENKVHGTDDVVMTHMGIGSQIDGLGHVGIDAVYYNGTPASEFIRPDGLAKFGTHLLPPIVTRGVLLDVAALKGVGRLDAGTAINQGELEAAAKRQGVEVEEGDVVLIHTGWGTLADSDAGAFLKGEPGLGVGGARYLAALGAVAVGADTWGVEVIPFENPKRPFEVHQTLLAKNGVYILENMNTAGLAADGVSEFLFVLGQPRFVGTVQAVINPVAIR